MWNQTLSDLQFHLANLFPLKEDIIRIAGTAGLPIAQLTVSDKGIIFWYNVLNEARKDGKLDEILMEARRLYPEDEKLSSFNAMMIGNDHEVNLTTLKNLCADIIREDQFNEAIPLVEEMIARSPPGTAMEENIVVRFANLHRHQQDAMQQEGRKRTHELKLVEVAKSELISLLQAL